jgi:hypothetical protein
MYDVCTNYLVPGPGTTSGTLVGLLALLSTLDGPLVLTTSAASGRGGGVVTAILAATRTFSAG